MEVLQTSPLGLLGTAPDATSITKLRANCQLSAGRANFNNFSVADLFCGGQYAGQISVGHLVGEGITWASRMNRADSSGGVGQI
jgi:hypothetical protein